ncbi:glutamate synthase family protein [Sphaerochaeta pleomorpha str. Grapes]|uniref:Glutamate synthase family protein n=1 Tax=Sphaerochaeta pleomorpha (strain ATCC BAA-1885 / DSM 22778 / Grapes) TaxID=158190 RepID=G8QY43_SPHPG|nr:glutamate synthase [Sphaerochaeta pleomorpha]AEV29608.1 glutamate synthase family protein [Sphaerochaeta pleomorpha str. Grapes]
MKTIQVGLTHFQDLNREIRECQDTELQLDDVNGQRYIGCALKNKAITINGTAGNALGSYLDGSTITVNGNAQDATGDTMNEGSIIVHGSCGDAAGYSMRGGRIFIRDSSGYRAGIHMKAYQEKQPVLIVGDRAGSFLGEYLAGGTIIVLGLNQEGKPPVGYFCGTGMHGGKIYLRCDTLPSDLPQQVSASDATKEDMDEISDNLEAFCQVFDLDKKAVLSHHFFVLRPNSSTPYKMLYTYV